MGNTIQLHTQGRQSYYLCIYMLVSYQTFSLVLHIVLETNEKFFSFSAVVGFSFFFILHINVNVWFTAIIIIDECYP